MIMGALRLFAGNACFMVREDSGEDAKEEFEQYIKEEGFRPSKPEYMVACSLNIFYINVNSMLYATGVKYPVKLTETIVDESPSKAFSVDEFKTIWNILKKARNNRSIENDDNSLIRMGTSCFIVRDDKLKDRDTSFWKYLESERFTSINEGNSSSAMVLINVKSMTYQGGLYPTIHSPFVGDSFDSCLDIDAILEDRLENYLSIDEFRTMWEIIRKYKEDEFTIEDLLDECESAYGIKDYDSVLEICDRILELDKDNERALEYRSSSLFYSGRYGEALECVDKAIGLYPTNYKFFNVKAYILTDSYRTDESMDCYNRSFALGGFDGDDERVMQYRAKSFLNKAKEDYYERKDKKEAYRNLMLYLKEYPEDDDIFKLRQELTNQYPLRYDKQLLYFETKAYKLFKAGFLKESFECYKNVLKACRDYKNNIQSIDYLGYDIISGRQIHELDNFRWYDEHLSGCILDFTGNYEEFFTRLFEKSSQTMDLCFDKARLYSKIDDEVIALNYAKELAEAYPDNEDIEKFYDAICFYIKMKDSAAASSESKEYSSLREYVEDVVIALMNSSMHYDKEGAIAKVKRNMDDIRKAYEVKYPVEEEIIDIWFN